MLFGSFLVADGMGIPLMLRDNEVATQPCRLPKGYLKEAHLAMLESWLDTKFVLPGTELRFGLDGLVGLLPGVGDIFTSGISAVFIADALKMGSRKRTVAKMLGNIAIDLTVGSIPLLGDLFDLAFRSNSKNLVLLQEERRHLYSQI